MQKDSSCQPFLSVRGLFFLHTCICVFDDLLMCFLFNLFAVRCVCVAVVMWPFFSFTADDAKDLSALCSHISVALENIKRADEADEVIGV